MDDFVCSECGIALTDDTMRFIATLGGGKIKDDATRNYCPACWQRLRGVTITPVIDDDGTRIKLVLETWIDRRGTEVK